MNKYFSSALSEDALLEQHREDMREDERRDASLDEALGFTFPASDPIALNCGLLKRLTALRAYFDRKQPRAVVHWDAGQDA